MEVVGVRFKKSGKVYYFDPQDFDIKIDDGLIVETARGIEYGQAVTGVRQIDPASLHSDLKPVIRVADEGDTFIYQDNIKRAQDAFDICQIKIKEHGLDMRLVDSEYTFDKKKLIFYFTADERIDFRQLVRDLASIFRIRIELRQIGVRDEAKLVGGLGSCGQPLCCKRFLTEFSPVSIQMAKDQNLSLNSNKISGCCGRLMCCLQFEQDHYEDSIRALPKRSQKVLTEEGEGLVVATNPLLRKVKVKIRKDEEDQVYCFDLMDVQTLID